MKEINIVESTLLPESIASPAPQPTPGEEFRQWTHRKHVEQCKCEWEDGTKCARKKKLRGDNCPCRCHDIHIRAMRTDTTEEASELRYRESGTIPPFSSPAPSKEGE